MADLVRHRKGTTFGAYLIMIFLTVILVILPFNIGLKMMVSNAMTLQADSHNLEHYLLFHRLIESPGSFLYTDPVLQRTYPLKIDSSRFNEETLEKLMDKNSRTILAVKVSLKTSEGTKELFYNKNLYDVIAPTASIRPKFGFIQSTYPFTVLSQGREIPGILTVSSGFERPSS